MTLLLRLLYFTGIVPFVLSATRKYYLTQDIKRWRNAKTYCQADHTNLAVIRSSDDMLQLKKEAQMHGFNSEAWIGLHNDVNSWRWSFNNEKPNYTDWGKYQPDNSRRNEECVVGHVHTDGKFNWYDQSCESVMPFICYNESAPPMYIQISDKMNWSSALTYCRQHHTDLAIMKNSTENQAAKKIAKTTSWIGLFRDSWKWTDENSHFPIQWASGQPDNYHQRENCGFIKHGQVFDAQCHTQRPFFCYSDVTGRKQTIKVKIQSKHDVNDPAVQAAILQEIQEKVKEHGMAENSMVKWVEQPGGVVFHKEGHNKD